MISLRSKVAVKLLDYYFLNPEAQHYINELARILELDPKNTETKLKEFEITPSKKMHVSLLELNNKLDKLLTIFEDAAHEMRVEEGGMSFVEKMRPLLEKMNKILEQNSEIASEPLCINDLSLLLKNSKRR